MNIFAGKLPGSVYRDIPAKVRWILHTVLLNRCLTNLTASDKSRTHTSCCGMRLNLRREY